MRLKPVNQIKLDLGINAGGRIQKFFTDACARHMDEYVPMDKGMLARYRIEGTEIVYHQPYARYQYYGLSKKGKPLNYHTDKHRLATSYWDKHMVSAEMGDIIDEIEKEIRKHGNK